jgi:hypothetical protein
VALHAVYCRYASDRIAGPYPYDETGTFPAFGLDGKDPSRQHPRFLSQEITAADVENGRLRTLMYMRQPWPRPFLPQRLDPRMQAQQALFSAVGELSRPVDALWDADVNGKIALQGRLQSLDSQPDNYLARMRLQSPVVTAKHQLFKKLLIPRAWRTEALDSLAAMGFTRGTLFPGLDGIGLATAQHLEREFALRDLLAVNPQEVDLPETPKSWNRPNPGQW